MPETTPSTDTVDFYLDPDVAQDPYPYYEALRAQCPVTREAAHGGFAITGYEEAVAVLNDTVSFSNCNSMAGPFSGFPGPAVGVDDMTALVEEHRHGMPMHEHLPMLDPPEHTAHRALLMRLITPKRLRENEAFMWRLADECIDGFVDRGAIEFIAEFSNPYANLAITDLLGVPEEDRPGFTEKLGLNPGAAGESNMLDALAFLYDAFSGYIEDRRANPRTDVLTGLATARFPDGSEPTPVDCARIAAFLFAAGGDTTSRILATSMRILGEDADLQQQLRADPTRIPNFVEEVLRYEGAVKADHRLTRLSTNIGGVDIPAGSVVAVLLGAANRDPRRFDDPNAFVADRPNARAHIAFGHGVHTCPGAPLARAEARIALERLLARLDDIRVSEEHHGPAGARRYEYEPTFVLRGLRRLALEFTPRG